MDTGGYMTSHVDHSTINDEVHFCNSILYLSDLNSKSSGATEFYSKNGLKIIKKIKAKENRLLIFIHTSQSFHGVSNILDKANKRYTIYMDYYIPKKKLYKLQKKYDEYRKGEKIKFWRHQTTFLPKSLFEFNRLKIYFKYLMKYFFQKL